MEIKKKVEKEPIVARVSYKKTKAEGDENERIKRRIILLRNKIDSNI